jgi:hypothetical protein
MCLTEREALRALSALQSLCLPMGLRRMLLVAELECKKYQRPVTWILPTEWME